MVETSALLLRSFPLPVSVAEVQVEVDTGGGDLTLLLRSLPIPVAFTEACVGAVSIPLATNEVPPDLEETLVPKTDVVVVTVWVEVEIASGDLTLLVAVAVAEVRVEALIKPLATNELSLNVPLPEVVLFTLD